MSVSYCRVTYDDGSTNDYPIEAFDILVRAMEANASTLRLTDLCGDTTFFFVYKVQDIYCSTPHGRERMRELNALLKEEKRAFGDDDEPWKPL